MEAVRGKYQAKDIGHESPVEKPSDANRRRKECGPSRSPDVVGKPSGRERNGEKHTRHHDLGRPFDWHQIRERQGEERKELVWLPGVDDVERQRRKGCVAPVAGESNGGFVERQVSHRRIADDERPGCIRHTHKPWSPSLRTTDSEWRHCGLCGIEWRDGA